MEPTQYPLWEVVEELTMKCRRHSDPLFCSMFQKSETRVFNPRLGLEHGPGSVADPMGKSIDQHHHFPAFWQWPMRTSVATGSSHHQWFVWPGQVHSKKTSSLLSEAWVIDNRRVDRFVDDPVTFMGSSSKSLRNAQDSNLRWGCFPWFSEEYSMFSGDVRN